MLPNITDEEVIFVEELQMRKVVGQESFEIVKGQFVRVERASFLRAERARRRDHQQPIFFQVFLDVGNYLCLSMRMFD